MYQIEYDEDLVLLTVTTKGYWTMEEFRAYEAEFLAMVAKIRKRHVNFRILSESAEFSVQSAEIGEAVTQAIGNVLKSNKGPLAVVVGSVLAKIQAERVFPYPTARIFTNSEEARQWLFSDGVLPEEDRP